MLQVYGRSLMEICYLLLFYITCSVCGAQVLYLNKKRLLKYGMRVMQFSLDPKSNSATSARTHTHTTQKNTHARVLRAHFKAIPLLINLISYKRVVNLQLTRGTTTESLYVNR